MFHPAENYVKYLVAIGNRGGKGLTHINKSLNLYCVPEIFPVYMEELENSFSLPQDLMPGNKKHKPTIKFMRETDLLPMWVPDSSTERMIREFPNRRKIMRELQTLIMGGIPPEIIAGKTSERYGITPAITTRMVEVYTFYFWNYMRLTTEEWLTLLRNHPFRDHMIAALDGSKDQALWRASYNPKVDGKKALRDAHRSLYYRIEATRMMPDTKETAEILTKYTKELAAIHHVLYSEGAMLEEIIREFRNVKLQTTPNKVRALCDLADDGTYSNSGKE